MLECPFCHEQVRPAGRDQWFECPACQNWIRLRVSQNGARWLEPGYYANEEIHPLPFARQTGHAPRTASRPSRANVEAMDLEMVQAQRQRAAARLNALEENIQRVIGLRSQNLKNEQMTSQLNTELSRYTREQNEWKLYERQLAARENELLEEEQEQARQARPSSSIPLAFWLGTIVSGAGIYAFTQLIQLRLDLRAYLYLTLIALISGLMTYIIAKIDGRNS